MSPKHETKNKIDLITFELSVPNAIKLPSLDQAQQVICSLERCNILSSTRVFFSRSQILIMKRKEILSFVIKTI